MANIDTTRRGTSWLTGMAILIALVVVLTILCNFISFGPVSITLALVPIIIGGAVLGVKAGTLLGFVFSLFVFLSGLFGWDKGFVMMLMSMNPLACILGIFLKGTAAGWLAALVYRWLADKNRTAAVVCAGIVCPVVNTGLFIADMLLFFREVLAPGAAASGQNILVYTMTAFVGVNFLIELAVILLLSTGTERIIAAVRNRQV